MIKIKIEIDVTCTYDFYIVTNCLLIFSNNKNWLKEKIYIFCTLYLENRIRDYEVEQEGDWTRSH